MNTVNPQAIEIGTSNAEMAFDQAAEYGGLEAAIENFSANVPDSLADAGLLTEENFAAASRAFDATVTACKAAR